MSRRLSSFCICLAAFSLAGGMAFKACAQGGRELGKPMDRNTQSLTNQSPLGPQKNSLRSMEEDLNQSFRLFAPNSSLQGVYVPRFTPPPSSVIQSPKVREMLEKRKNWMLSTEDDPSKSGLSGGFNFPGFSETPDPKKQSLDDFYKNLERGGLGSLNFNSLKSDDPLSARALTGNALPGQFKPGDVPEALRTTERSLRDLLGTSSGSYDSLSPAPARSSFSDFFALGDAAEVRERELAHKAYMKEYQQVLTPSAPPAANPFAFNPAPSAAPATPGYVGADPFAVTQKRMDSPQLGMINPSLSPTLPDVNSKVLNEWNPLYTPPKVETPRVVSPPSPTFQAPRRVF